MNKTKTIFYQSDTEGLDEIAEALLNEKVSSGNVPLVNLTEPENWIFLEGRQHGRHTYPDLYVCLNRLACTPEVERIKGNFDFEVKNTAQLDSGIPYIGNINYERAMRLARQLGYPISLRTGADFLKELRDGARGAKEVYDGNGNKINDARRLEKAFKEIVEVREPWRAEWFSDKFGENTITYTIIKPDGTSEEITEPVDGLMQDKKPGVSLDYWLDNATPQGLPPLDVSDGDLWYWKPINGRIARFGAGSGGVDLGPVDSDASLGVRLARRAAP